MFGTINNNISGLLAAKSQFTAAATKVMQTNVSAFNAVANGASSAAGLRHKAYNNNAPQTKTNPNNNIPNPSNGSKETSSTGQISVTSQNLSLYDPHSSFASNEGYLAVPGEQSLIAEVAEMSRASHAYKANAKVIKSLDETISNFMIEIK